MEHMPICKLSADNYDSWKLRLNSVLDIKEIGHVLTENVPEKEHKDYKEFCKNDKVARAIIVHSLPDRFLNIIEGKATAKSAFEAIKFRFERIGSAGRAQLRRELHEMKFNMRDDLAEFIVKFDTIIAKLSTDETKFSEADKIAQFLLTLPNDFASAISSIETVLEREKDVTFEFVTKRLLNEELKLKSSSISKSNHVQSQVLIACYKCGKNGHIQRDCRFNKNNTRNYNQQSNSNFNKYSGDRDNANKGRRGNYRGNFFQRGGRGSNIHRMASQAEATNESQQNNDEKGTRVVFYNGPIEQNANINESNKQATFLTNSNNQIRFVLDSGASLHMIYEQYSHLLVNYRKFEKVMPIETAKKNVFITVIGCGDLLVKYKDTEIYVESIYVTNDLNKTLFSVDKLQLKGFSLTFGDNKALLTDRNNKLILSADRSPNGIYSVELELIPPSGLATINNNADEQDFKLPFDTDKPLWHRRMGHSSAIKMPDDCIVCVESKMSKSSHTKQRERAKSPLEKIHVDVCGPNEPTGINGERYFLAIVDDYSHFIAVYPMKLRSEAAEMIKEYKELYEKQFKSEIRKIRCDAGGEFLGRELKDVLKGVEFEITPPYTHALNGVAERAIRTVSEMGRAMILEENLPKYYWPDAVRYAAYILNRLPSRSIENKIPIMKLGMTPKYSRIRVFGCEAHAHVEKQFRNRFDSKTKKMRFIGITNTGFILIDPETKRRYVRTDVTFFEKSKRSNDIRLPITTIDIQRDNDNDQEKEQEEKEYTMMDFDEESPECENLEIELNRDESPERSEPNTFDPPGAPTPRRSGRVSTRPLWHQDYEVYHTECISDETTMSYEEARELGWKEAIEDEVNNINENKTWTLVNDDGQERIDAIWIFRTKRDPQGNELKKARLVARGCKQPADSDQYAHVPTMTTVRMLISVCVQRNMFIHQIDVKAAYLNSKLNQDIYMKIPKGFENAGKLCKLEKAIYGLRQASKAWLAELENFLNSIGFIKSEVDKCLYKKARNDDTYIINYVDDILICSKNVETIEIIKGLFKSRYKIKDFSEAKYFIGLELERSYNSVRVTQKSFVEKLLKDTDMHLCKSRSSPMEQNASFRSAPKDWYASDEEIHKYRSIIGALTYLATRTRPDIAYATNKLARYQNNPTDEHFTGVKRILRYLSTTITFGIEFRKRQIDTNGQNPIRLKAYSDASHADDLESGVSTSGLCIFIDDNLVEWRSKKQTLVAASSYEAELIALTEAAQEMRFAVKLCREFNISLKTSQRILYCDNTAAITVAKGNDTIRTRTLLIKHQFITQAIKEGEFMLQYVKTKENIADQFTKPLGKTLFLRLMRYVVKGEDTEYQALVGKRVKKPKEREDLKTPQILEGECRNTTDSRAGNTKEEDDSSDDYEFYTG